MRQERFEQRYAEEWGEATDALSALERLGDTSAAAADFPERYRRLCQQLSLARYRGYSPAVVERLNRLAMSGHHQLYQRASSWRRDLVALVAEDFPRCFRAEWRLITIAHLLFYVPMVGMILGVLNDPSLVYSVLSGADVAGMEAMYDPAAEHHLRERPSDSDIYMFGFYIRNNISIAFRTFASGVLAGVGSLFFLGVNGFHIGAAAGHLTQVVFSSTFWSFVITHGSFELTAIVLSGAAGLRLGIGLVAPGRLTRGRSLVAAGRRALPLLYGLTGFLFIAAFIEAFWSSSVLLPDAVKYAVGTLCWVLVYGYLLLAGRTRGA